DVRKSPLRYSRDMLIKIWSGGATPGGGKGIGRVFASVFNSTELRVLLSDCEKYLPRTPPFSWERSYSDRNSSVGRFLCDFFFFFVRGMNRLRQEPNIYSTRFLFGNTSSFRSEI